MIPLRCIIVQGLCELKQRRKERTGIRRFFLMESIFFPFAFRMVSAPSPTRPPAREPPATPLFTPGAKTGSHSFKGQQNFFFPF
ncbi:hypothetical protein [Paenibacillus xylanexedens]|uniref:hypothetical protein n=1 Tax=Paenibacillus xylanexedens TaxID=528191 RepID=UPI0012F4A966|nr:hypothetical protein [Paenibacillus xylanexedens]